MSRLSDYITTLAPTAHYRLLDKTSNSGFDPTLTGGNTTLDNDYKTAKSVNATWGMTNVNVPITAGQKVYVEFTSTTLANWMCGVTKTPLAKNSYHYNDIGDAALYFVGSNTTVNYYYYLTSILTTTITDSPVDAVIGMAIDYDNNTIDYYINNVLNNTLNVVTDLGQAAWGTDPIYIAQSLYGVMTITLRTTLPEFTYTPPVGYSALEVTTDQIVADETGTYDATEVNITDLDYDPSLLLEERSGNSYSFNGTDAYIDLPAIPIGTAFSINFLCKPNSTATIQPIVLNSTYGALIRFNQVLAGDVRFYVYSGTTIADVTVAGVDMTETHMITMTATENGTMECYIDGVSVGSAPVGTFLQIVDGFNDYIGVSRSLTNYFSGNMQEVAIFPDVLTPTEIAQMYEYVVTQAMYNVSPSLVNTATYDYYFPDLSSMILLSSNPIKTLASSDDTLAQTYYHVKGRVTYDGENQQDILLRLYDRATGVLMGETISEFDGTYEFTTKVLGTDKYYVVAFDKTSIPVLNAKIKDYLDPIEII